MAKFCYTPTLQWASGKALKGLRMSSRDTQRAVGAKGKYWMPGDTIKIFFIGGTINQRDFVTERIQRLKTLFNLNLTVVNGMSQSDIRISFDEGLGSWSYVGTDCLYISKNVATMNFGWLDNSVVLHEMLHALGMHHEHQNPSDPIVWNRAKVIEDLSGPPNYWSIAQIEHNVLNALDPAKVDATNFDSKSIMLYYFPPEWTVDGKGSGQMNDDLSPVDISFLQEKYPFDDVVDPVPEDTAAKFTLKEIFSRKRDLKCLTEEDVVRLLALVGINASVDDLKRDSVDRLWAYIESL